MQKLTLGVLTSSLLVLLFAIPGCGKHDANPLAAFEPEIINTADAFQFQITDAANVTVTRSYTWDNTATRATIDHSTATLGGSASVVILDVDSTQVYSSGLVASANEPSESGTPGVWIVRVTFSNFSGTANFRVQKL